MRAVLGLDFEATGLDTSVSEIIEVGAAVWSVEDKAPLATLSRFVRPEVLPIPEEVAKLTGIKDVWLEKYGVTISSALCEVDEMCKKYSVEAIVAHNGIGYDFPLMEACAKRVGQNPIFFTLPRIDTRQDLPFEYEPTSRRLAHLALDSGFINPFPHRALMDVLTMMRIFSCYDYDKILANSKIPFATLRAMVSFDDRQLAKDARFSWEKIGDKTYAKQWVKQVRENLVELEQKNAEAKGFKVLRIE